MARRKKHAKTKLYTGWGSYRVVGMLSGIRTRTGSQSSYRGVPILLTAQRCVSWVVTNLALIQIDSQGFLLKELAPGVTAEEVRQATAAPLRVADELKEMDF